MANLSAPVERYWAELRGYSNDVTTHVT